MSQSVENWRHYFNQKIKGFEVSPDSYRGLKSKTIEGQSRFLWILRRAGIEKRPIEVDQKQRIGDTEIDLIIGKNHNGALVTMNDSACGLLTMRKSNSKEASEIEKIVIEGLQPWKLHMHTITSDNGKEFANHKEISTALNIDYYFARPYHSWEREFVTFQLSVLHKS